MHSGITTENNNSTASMGIPKPQAGASHYASLGIVSPQPIRRVNVNILDTIEEMEEPAPELPITKRARTAPPKLAIHIPTTNTRDRKPKPDSSNDSSYETTSNESRTGNEHRVRRVRFAEEVTIIPNKTEKHVHWPADSKIVTYIPDAEYSDEAPVKHVRFAASPDLVTYIPDDSSVEDDSDFDEPNNNNNNNNNTSEYGSPGPHVHFSPEPAVRRSIQVDTLYNIEAREEVPRPDSVYNYPRLRNVIDRSPTPPAYVPLSILGSEQVQEEQDIVMTDWDDEESLDGSRNASEFGRTETLEDFVYLARHSKKRKRRMRRAFAGVAAGLSKIVKKRKKERTVEDVYCW